MMNLITRKGSKLHLSNGVLTGDTFQTKDYIKSYLDGKWDANAKGWRVNVQKLEGYLASGNSIGLRIDTDAVVETKPTSWTYEHFCRSADDSNSDY